MGKFKPTTDNIIGRHARRAAQIMEKRGWVRGIEENEAGQVCLMGAFRRAISPLPPNRQGIRSMFNMRFANWLRENYPEPYLNWTGESVRLSDLYCTPAWNDQIFTCEKEALAWLNKFADDLDPQR